MALAVVRRITSRFRRLVEVPEPAPRAMPERASPRTTVAGRLCISGAVQLRRRLFGLLKTAPDRALTLDLSGVRLMDGSALAVLVEFAQACIRRGATLRLMEPSQQVWDTFNFYGLTQVLIELAEFESASLDGVLIVIEEDFPESICLPAAA